MFSKDKYLTPLMTGIDQRIDAIRSASKPDLKELERAYNKRLEVLRVQEGDTHRLVYESLARSGVFAYADGRPADGKRYFGQMLELAEKNFGKDSPMSASQFSTVAQAHDLLGNLQESATNYKRAIGILEKSEFKSNVEVQKYASSTLKGYAEVLTKLKDSKGAEEALERAKRIDDELRTKAPNP